MIELRKAERNAKIVLMDLARVKRREIAAQFGISVCRVQQIAAKYDKWLSVQLRDLK